MLKKTDNYMKIHEMPGKGEKVVLGLSGGMDSVCLFHVLRELGISLEAVHVNHGIRGEEADRDQAFAEALCRQYEIPLHVYRFDVPKLAKERHLSEEEAGREVRRQAFAEVKAACGAKAIALAHHGNDRAETFLFHLIRGSGIRGLSSMKPVEEDRIRPLLWAQRSEIEAFVRSHGYAYVEDSTNEKEMYTRNQLRHRVLPQLETINPKAVSHICGAAGKLEEAFSYIDRQADKLFEKSVTIGEGEVLVSDVILQEAEAVLWVPVVQKCVEHLKGSTVNMTEEHYAKVLELFELQTGKEIHLPAGLAAARTYEGVRLYVSAENMQFGSKEIFGEGLYEFAGKKFAVTIEEWAEWKNFPVNHYTKCFDYDKILENLCLRTRETGDYLEINKDHGRKSLQDYFVNEKVPKEKRDRMVLLAEGSHILWVIGKRISEYYKITGATKKVLKIQMYGEDHEEV